MRCSYWKFYDYGKGGAGGADGFVAEEDGLLRSERADAVVVDDLDDLDLVRAGDGLREFVVVHEDEFAVHFLEEVGLGQDAHGAAGLIEDGKRLERRGRGDVLHFAQGFVVAEGEEVLVQHVVHGNRAAAEHRGGGGVVRRNEQADFVFLRGLDGLRLDVQTAGDDDRAHAFAGNAGTTGVARTAVCRTTEGLARR